MAVNQECLEEFVGTVAQKREEDRQWQYFLNKIFDRSFEEFQKDLLFQKPPPKTQVSSILEESRQALERFSPPEEVSHGAV